MRAVVAQPEAQIIVDRSQPLQWDRNIWRDSGEHTLQTTVLVHEAYLRLCGTEPIQWQDRAHFFAVAPKQLRRVLVDHASSVRSEKRSGGKINATLFDSDGAAWHVGDRLMAMDQEELDACAAKLIELRFFGGSTEIEAAEALDISVATIKRDWDFARNWLATQLT